MVSQALSGTHRSSDSFATPGSSHGSFEPPLVDHNIPFDHGPEDPYRLRGNDSDGRQPPRLGGDVERDSGTGSVVELRIPSSNKCPGTQGHPLSTALLQDAPERWSRTDQDGQHYSQGPHQQAGRPEVIRPAQRSLHPASVGRGQSAISLSGAHKRRGQSASGLAKLPSHPSGRVVSAEEFIPKSSRALQPARGGSVRLTPQSSSTAVLHEVLSPLRGGHGCPGLSVATRTTVCVFAHPPFSKGVVEDQTAMGISDPNSTVVAEETVVFHPPCHVGSAAISDSAFRRDATSGTHSASPSSTTTADRLAVEQSQLLNLGLSVEVTSTILSSRRPSTVRIYNATWRIFHRWCIHRSADALSTSPRLVLDFLQEGLNRKLRPATLRRQVTAIDSVLSVHNGNSLARHSLIQRFLKGVTLQSPPQRHRYPTWSLELVLRALMRGPFEPIREVDLKWVRLKTIFLVAITSARRVSELGALSCHPNLCSFQKDKVVLRLDPSFLPKVLSDFHRNQEISLPSFCPHPRHRLEREWHTLDVRRAL